MIQVSLGNDTLGSHTFSDFGIMVKSYNLPSMPSRKSGDIDVPGAYGSFRVTKQKRKQSELVFNCVMSEAEQGEIQKRLFAFSAALYNDSEPLKVEVSDWGNYYVRANLEEIGDHKVIKGIDNYLTSFDITFTMNDPFFYDKTDKRFGPYSTWSGTRNLINGGYEQGAKFILTSSTSVESENEATITVNGEIIKYNSGVVVNKPVIIDTQNFIVTVGDEQFLEDWSGAMPHLVHGNNSIEFTCTQSDVRLQVLFNERFL